MAMILALMFEHALSQCWMRMIIITSHDESHVLIGAQFYKPRHHAIIVIKIGLNTNLEHKKDL